MSTAHCTTRAAMNRVNPVALYPYFRRKVIRKPKPMKIITWMSWNSAGRNRSGKSGKGLRDDHCLGQLGCQLIESSRFN